MMTPEDVFHHRWHLAAPAPLQQGHLLGRSSYTQAESSVSRAGFRDGPALTGAFNPVPCNSAVLVEASGGAVMVRSVLVAVVLGAIVAVLGLSSGAAPGVVVLCAVLIAVVSFTVDSRLRRLRSNRL